MSDVDYLQLVRSAFEESAATQRAAVESLAAPLVAAARAIAGCHASGGTLFTFGNGGSAADAQHFAAELVGRYRNERRPLAAVALGSDAAVSTCIANDYSFDEVFARPLQALARQGDVAFGISTSGRSANVVKALVRAGEMGLRTICLIGAGPSPLTELVDITLSIPSTHTARIQECHITAIHALTEMVESLLAPSVVS